MNKYKTLFDLSGAEPDQQLLGRIMQKIQTTAKRGRYIRQGLAVCGFCLSFMPLFASFAYLRQDLLSSGFVQYFSLIFTDAGIVLSNWQDYMLSLAESLPVEGLIIFTGSTLLLFFSLYLFSSSLRKNGSIYKLA